MKSSISLSGCGECRVDICCNDPDNGAFAGRAAAIQVYDLLELTANDMLGPRFRECCDRVVLSGRHFKITGSKEYFGNWCWNAYWMSVETAVNLLASVHARGKFNPDLGESRIFSMWKRKAGWDASDREFLGRQIAKARLAQ